MLNYTHTWSEFRHENKNNPLLLPPNSKDQFDLLLARIQLIF